MVFIQSLAHHSYYFQWICSRCADGYVGKKFRHAVECRISGKKFFISNVLICLSYFLFIPFVKMSHFKYAVCICVIFAMLSVVSDSEIS